MVQVRIVSPRVPKRIGNVGDIVELPERAARRWMRRGLVASPEATSQPAAARPTQALPVADPALADLTVTELRALAEERGIEPDGTGANGNVVKADLVRALAGRYHRRDLRAEE